MSRRAILPKFIKRPIPMLLAFMLVVGSAWAIWGREDKPVPTPPSDSKDGTYVNLNPPTEAEKNPAQDTPTKPRTAPSSNKKQVSPIITGADKQSVYAYVSGVIEDGGTCTATYTHGQDKVTASSQAFSNVSYTSCKRIVLDAPLNISGTWSVVVSYSSSTSEGNSQSQTVEVK